MPRKIQPIPLTAAAFVTYGDVIEVSDSGESRLINEGHTTRYHDLATLTLTTEGGIPTINIFRSEPLAMPLVLKTMERHPLSSQAFFPLGSSPYIVAVAPAGELNPEAIAVFIASPGQGVNYHPGTWHHYSLALHNVSDFLVIDRDGPLENCDEVNLSPEAQVEIVMEGVG